MNTHDLVAFVAVVETGSIVAASARLNLTQPGVTRRIQNLEEMLGRSFWIGSRSPGCGFRDTLKRKFDASHLPFNIAVEALDSELRLSLVSRGLGVGLVTPIALKRSAFRDRLKPVAARDFKPAVRAWVVHRAPAGRLERPIKLFRDGLVRELQALIGG